jgi:levanase/fructan beta-fructosidase
LEADAALEFKLFLDKTSLEIFYDQGATVMSEIFFLNAPFDQLSVEATEGIEIKALEVFGID